MSHYAVTVITKDGDYYKALAPYDEELKVEPYVEKTKEEIILEMKKLIENHKSGDMDDEALYQYYREEECYDIDFDEDGNQLSTYNPDSRWDWYEVGGRWDCKVMRLKDGTYTNHAQVKDIDFSPEPMDDETLAWHKRFWEIKVGGAKPKNDEEKRKYASLWNKTYYLERYGTFEKYIEFQQGFYTHAFILDGEWYEPGRVGWFGMDDSTGDSLWKYREKLLEVVSKLDPNDWVTIVDCHI